MYRACRPASSPAGLTTPIPGGFVYKVTENDQDKTYSSNGSVWLLRSYNRDATETILKNISAASSPPINGTGAELVFSASTSVADLVASKNYVAATATPPHNGNRTAVRGYEGIFKTVVAAADAKQSNTDWYGGGKAFERGKGIRLYGSNNLNPSPSIAGFPLFLDMRDTRYCKYLDTNAQIQFITTEIVSPWFLMLTGVQNQSSIMSSVYPYHGEVGNTLTGGYGDLTYTFRQDEL